MCVCVCVCERERESVCVCVSICTCMHVRMCVAAVLSVSTHMLQCKFVIDVYMYSTSNHMTVNYCIIGFIMCVCVCVCVHCLPACMCALQPLIYTKHTPVSHAHQFNEQTSCVQNTNSNVAC